MKNSLFTCVALFICASSIAQGINTNLDESKVLPYTLPDPLTTDAGKPVKNVKEWETVRRPEILALFQENVYGKTPETKVPVRVVVNSVDNNALNGSAIRKQISLYLGEKESTKMDILLYLPAKIKKPVPVFLGLNFEGNHSINADPGITLSTRWMRYDKVRGIVNHFSTEASRGVQAGRWNVEEILARGYGVATVYQGDIELDRVARSAEDVHNLFPKPGPGDWGSIGAWSWGLSRALDYLITDKDVDGKRVAVLGHSRLGKAALWAGALDKRFALVISNNSGEGGASLYRRNYGERIADLTKAVPYWFCENFKGFTGHEDALPVDAHELIALIAPRPIYVASAVEDTWADPKGEFLSLYHAGPVYKLYGKKGLESDQQPGVGEPVGSGSLGYHVREGVHNVTLFDWQQYLNFADLHLKK